SVVRGLTGYKARHNLALVYDAMGRLDRAEAEWRQVVEEVPSYRIGWGSLGDTLVRQGKFTDSEQGCVHLCGGGASLHGEARILRGRLAAARGDVQRAAHELALADQAEPKDLDPLMILCRILFEQGAPEAAEMALCELTNRAPDDACAYHNLGAVR